MDKLTLFCKCWNGSCNTLSYFKLRLFILVWTLSVWRHLQAEWPKILQSAKMCASVISLCEYVSEPKILPCNKNIALLKNPNLNYLQKIQIICWLKYDLPMVVTWDNNFEKLLKVNRSSSRKQTAALNLLWLSNVYFVVFITKISKCIKYIQSKRYSNSWQINATAVQESVSLFNKQTIKMW